MNLDYYISIVYGICVPDSMVVQVFEIRLSMQFDTWVIFDCVGDDYGSIERVGLFIVRAFMNGKIVV